MVRRSTMSAMAGILCANAICAISIGAIAVCATAGAETYSPPVARDFPDNVFWGDTHLHTNMSVDANGMGNQQLSPDDAYRFAKGESVRAHNGQQVRLARPLDFLVVADHAVNLGVMPRMQARDPILLATEVGRRWREIWDDAEWSPGAALNAESREEWRNAMRRFGVGSGAQQAFFWRAWSTDYVANETFRRSVWDEVCANAERHHQPGTFTSFIGYEWTPPTRDLKSPNFHRNVIFEGGPEHACRLLPFSIQDSSNVEDLWAHLDRYEGETGGKVLAIPHNGNLSNGRMFLPVDFDGKPIDEDYARTRKRWEPIYEMTQIKGDAETHPVLSPDDEFADFETWPRHERPHILPVDERPDDFADKKRHEYARSALMVGLDLKARLGVNPFKFGMIGATDSHTGLATADEDNWWGKHTMVEVNPYRAVVTWHYAAGGYAAVWARENTRAAIFAAMQRREAYATTGPRMRVRFFGGFDFASDDAARPDLAATGYAKGVPMGGDLTAAPAESAPGFLIRAVKDPDGANLDRLQVVKGWRDADGDLHERVYDVALSDGRSPNPQGKVDPVGSTVDGTRYDNSIGDPELAAVWHDPDFDPQALAFYYVRVLQIPTPRWTAYDAAFYTLDKLPEHAPMVIQERAYTSPIWYTP